MLASKCGEMGPTKKSSTISIPDVADVNFLKGIGTVFEQAATRFEALEQALKNIQSELSSLKSNLDFVKVNITTIANDVSNPTGSNSIRIDELQKAQEEDRQRQDATFVIIDSKLEDLLNDLEQVKHGLEQPAKSSTCKEPEEQLVVGANDVIEINDSEAEMPNDRQPKQSGNISFQGARSTIQTTNEAVDTLEGPSKSQEWVRRSSRPRRTTENTWLDDSGRIFCTSFKPKELRKSYGLTGAVYGLEGSKTPGKTTRSRRKAQRGAELSAPDANALDFDDNQNKDAQEARAVSEQPYDRGAASPIQADMEVDGSHSTNAAADNSKVQNSVQVNPMSNNEQVNKSHTSSKATIAEAAQILTNPLSESQEERPRKHRKVKTVPENEMPAVHEGTLYESDRSLTPENAPSVPCCRCSKRMIHDNRSKYSTVQEKYSTEEDGQVIAASITCDWSFDSQCTYCRRAQVKCEPVPSYHLSEVNRVLRLAQRMENVDKTTISSQQKYHAIRQQRRLCAVLDGNPTSPRAMRKNHVASYEWEDFMENSANAEAGPSNSVRDTASSSRGRGESQSNLMTASGKAKQKKTRNSQPPVN